MCCLYAVPHVMSLSPVKHVRVEQRLIEGSIAEIDKSPCVLNISFKLSIRW